MFSSVKHYVATNLGVPCCRQSSGGLREVRSFGHGVSRSVVRLSVIGLDYLTCLAQCGENEGEGWRSRLCRCNRFGLLPVAC